ncbi:MAG: hypothetical protein WBZ16_01695, partial [Pseudolabrys sp.]
KSGSRISGPPSPLMTHLGHLAGSKSEAASAIAQRPVRVASIEACDAASVLDRATRTLGATGPGMHQFLRRSRL